MPARHGEKFSRPVEPRQPPNVITEATGPTGGKKWIKSSAKGSGQRFLANSQELPHRPSFQVRRIKTRVAHEPAVAIHGGVQLRQIEILENWTRSVVFFD